MNSGHGGELRLIGESNSSSATGDTDGGTGMNQSDSASRTMKDGPST